MSLLYQINRIPAHLSLNGSLDVNFSAGYQEHMLYF